MSVPLQSLLGRGLETVQFKCFMCCFVAVLVMEIMGEGGGAEFHCGHVIDPGAECNIRHVG